MKMTLVAYLDRVDSLIIHLLNKKKINGYEALDLQNKAYSYDDFTLGIAWITRKFDELNK